MLISVPYIVADVAAVYGEAGYAWLGIGGPDAAGLVMEVYFRCCQKIMAARDAVRRLKGSPTASPTVRAAGSEQVA
jgi:hypothetical protein